MKLLFFNYMGPTCPQKKCVIGRLVEENFPNVIFLQETLGYGDVIVNSL